MALIKKCEKKLEIDNYANSKVITMGHITEVTTVSRKGNGSPTRKVDKDHYVDLRNGELFDYKHIENRAGSTQSIRNTLSRIRALINTNVTVPENCRWVTLTYAENMTDTKRLYDDYFKFWKRFCYWCKKKGYQKPEYITVQEPQGRGAWHIHAFFIWSCKAPFIPNDDMSLLWSQGFTKTKAMQDCDNVGAYFSAYLGDMPLDEAKQLSDAEIGLFTDVSIEVKSFTDDDGLTKEKKFIKGGRLYLYPSGMNIVRNTKGIKQPLIENMTYLEAKEKVSAATETFSCSYLIENDMGELVNTITKSYYNSKRKK